MGEETVLRLSDLRRRGGARFALAPDEAARAGMARALDVLALPALRFEGRVEPQGDEDWRLEGRLDARVVQSCVVTLEPVESAVSEPVERLYLAAWTEPEDAEVEMPEEDREPLPAAIDLLAVAREALALALPPYPRAPGVELGEAVFAAPGAAPLTDADARPFAGLAALRDRLGGEPGSE